MADCEPFWMGFVHTEEILDCPESAGATWAFPLMYALDDTTGTGRTMLWGSHPGFDSGDSIAGSVYNITELAPLIDVEPDDNSVTINVTSTPYCPPWAMPE